MSKQVRRFKLPRSAPRRNRHHLIPRSRGGTDARSNLLMIREDRHELWHRLWGDRTLNEVLELLTRVKHMKERSAA